MRPFEPRSILPEPARLPLDGNACASWTWLFAHLKARIHPPVELRDLSSF
jgi:hypothetical protein